MFNVAPAPKAGDVTTIDVLTALAGIQGKKFCTTGEGCIVVAAAASVGAPKLIVAVITPATVIDVAVAAVGLVCDTLYPQI